MGYSTTLYAVDLDALKSKIGSSDAALMKRFGRAKKKQATRAKHETQGPRVKVTKDSELFLNGQAVSFDELIAALYNPAWKGTYLYEYQEIGGKRSGVFRKLGSFAEAFYPALPPNHYIGTMCCNSEQELLTGWQDDDISLSQACLELVAGNITRPDCAPQYGYALEKLCSVLGTHLATIEGRGGILSHLALDTRLCDERSPVDLPERDDFPTISYLASEEVQRELAQLATQDLSFPESPEAEEDRRTFFEAMQKAASKQLGIVAFYY